MDKLKKKFKENGINIIPKLEYKIFNLDQSHYPLDTRPDYSLIWEQKGRKINVLRFDVLKGLFVKYDDVAQTSSQFVIYENGDDVRIYRRGTMLAYFDILKKNNVTWLMNGDTINISKMKHYITADEFAPWVAKVKLLGLEYSDLDFWKAFKFPRRSEGTNAQNSS